MPFELVPGATIGILGGGQLGRMLALAAAKLGLKTHVYAPRPREPGIRRGKRANDRSLRGRAEIGGVRGQGRAYHLMNSRTFPSRAAAILSDACLVGRGPAALAICQDRLAEKEFLTAAGIKTAPYMRVDDAGALARAVAQIGRPSILKTRRFGYDGKGQVLVREGADLAVMFRTLGGSPRFSKPSCLSPRKSQSSPRAGQAVNSLPMTSARISMKIISLNLPACPLACRPR